MSKLEKVIKGLDSCGSDIADLDKGCETCPYYEFSGHTEHDFDFNCVRMLSRDAIKLIGEQDSRIKKYEYLFDFLGSGFREWATKIIDGEAEAICEVDEHKRETVIRFKHI